MRRYEKSFKEEAVKLAKEIGVRKTGEEIGVPYYTIKEWVEKEKRYGEQAHVGQGRERIEKGREKERQLEKEIKELRRANEILKGALSFFEKDQKK